MKKRFTHPIVVYQMGKVGSMTVQRTLEKYLPGELITHAHCFSWEGIESAEKYYQEQGRKEKDLYMARSKYARALFDKTKEIIRWRFITLVREPVSRDISDLFENMNVLLPDAGRQSLSRESLCREIELFLKKKYATYDAEKEYLCTWFDREMKEVLDFDIYSIPFDWARGYQIYSTAHADILCIRLEDLNRCYRQAFREFLGVDIPRLANHNVTSQKPDKALYKYVHDTLCIEPMQAERVYSSKLVRHFYSSEEIQRLVDKWTTARAAQLNAGSRLYPVQSWNRKKKILIVHSEGNINNNPNLSGLAEILCEQGYEVDIASPRREGIIQKSPHPAARMLLVDSRVPQEIGGEWVLLAGQPMRSMAEIQAATAVLDDYDFIFGVDRTIVEASVIAHARRIPYALISYEIFFASETSAEYKKPEILACKNISFAICQDPVRAEQLSRENHIPREKMILIPVAGRGCLPRRKSTLLHDRLGIDRSRNIVLFSGNVETYCMIDELVQSAFTWPRIWALVLHNRYGLDKRTREYYKKYANHEMVYFSTEPVETPDQMYTLLHCADIGAALYKPVPGSKWAGNNVRYLGLASGKIATYLQHGLPVLINENGQMSDYVRRYELGKVHPGGFPIQMDDVAENLSRWSRNTQPFFRDILDLDQTSKPLLEKLSRLLNQKPELSAAPSPAVSCPCADLKTERTAENKTIAVATSLAPGNIDNQQKAVQSWLRAGFRVISVNNPDEIEVLRAHFPCVCFVPAARNGKAHLGKPLIYIDDLLAALKETQFEIVGIINSDIHLSLEKGHLNAIAQQTQEAVVCVNRMNVEHLGRDTGEMYVGGFDALFFHPRIIERIPASKFCLGATWWDYYVPMVCILNQIPLVRFQDPVAFHINHPLNWDRNQWLHMGRYFFHRLLELCQERVGYNQFSNLGSLFGNAWKCYHLRILEKKAPDAVVYRSIAYTEFVFGIICGHIKILDSICSPRKCDTSFLSLPDPNGPFPATETAFLDADSAGGTHLTDITSPLSAVIETSPTWGSSRKRPPDLPRITVVTPSFNQARYLEACIQSVLSQGYPNLEYIIMDGGSSDGSVEIIKKYEHRLAYWQSQKDGGQYAAIEEGFRRSTGHILTWLNSDDVFLPEAFLRAAGIFLNRPDIRWITSKVLLLNEDGSARSLRRSLIRWNRAKYLNKEYKYIQQEGSFWRRDLWEQAGGFLRKDIELAGDLELWTRFFRYADLHSVEEYFAGFRFQPGQKTNTMLKEYNQEAEQILDLELQHYIKEERRAGHQLREAPEPISSLKVRQYVETVIDLQDSAGSPISLPVSVIRVSAIVSTYNSETFIRGCLQDLVDQTLYQKGELEIVVINSGSQQNEEAIIKKFQRRYPHIRYLKTNQREGLYAAWNRAVRAARGKYLTNANTDDRHRPDALEIMAEELDRNPHVGLVYGDQVITDIPNVLFSSHHGKLIPRPDYTPERLLFGCCVGSQPMWRKSLHEEMGYFDESLTVAADWDFWLRISQRYPLRHIPQFLGLYYQNVEGLEHSREIHSLYERYIVGKRYGNPYISVVPRYTHRDNPLISVIMPAYNAADYISEAIESVLIQNYQNLELLIVNDGSSDDTEAIVKRFEDSRIRYFVQPHAGPSAARNLAIRNSRGQFVINLDHDDMISLDHAAKLLAAYDEHPEADMIYCDTLLANEDGTPIRVHQRGDYQNPNHLIRDLFQAGFPIIPFRTLIRRRVFDRIGYYDESLKVGEDYDMLRRFLQYGLVARHVSETLYFRRVRKAAASRNVTEEKARHHFAVVKRFMETFGAEQLFPDVRWEQVPAGHKDYLFHYLSARALIAMGQQYKKAGSSAFLIEMARDNAMEQISICRSMYPERPEVLELLDQCREPDWPADNPAASGGSASICEEVLTE